MMALGWPWPILPLGQILLHMVLYGKKENDFSERIAACDLKAGRCSQLNE